MKTERIFNFFYAIGAAIVVLGALQKITHREMADTFLTIGLMTEVIIFTITGIQELFKKHPNQVESYPKIEGVNNSELTESINQLNKTIKQVFNQ